MKATILIIDDDEKLNELLQDYLGSFGYQVLSAIHPEEGFTLLQRHTPELIILDVMLPDMDGFEICKKIRQDSEVPIIMLTARGDLTDRVVGLELGADDYLAKPFEPRELVARIQSVLRRSGEKKSSPVLHFGPLSINFNNHEVTLEQQLVDLTSAEYELLTLFTQNAGIALSRDRIMEEVRGIEWESFNRSVDVLVSRLRHKLNDDPKHPTYLKTIWGTGYLFLQKQT
ncbi:MAG: DNA-binding response regulator [SAR324 cluster bacterium]|uniref:DNA-binding response regulator n=1 Tax=SAR324 cluster bacterium TaxID=2024889 RepID=A0A2A4TA73_9DELT|nr:MAG: DNA-binding response regulator [SAR324 cluster bacterium]